jgi:DNA-binding MarR family transcriptional regulator
MVMAARSGRDEKLERVGRALGGMVYRFEEAMARAARQGKLHPTDFHCISFLAERSGPISSKSIVTYLGITSGSGTALFDRLERLGYIHRLPNTEDRRGIMIALDRIAAHEPLLRLEQMRAEYQKVTVQFSDAELDTIAAYMEDVSKISDKANQPP